MRLLILTLCRNVLIAALPLLSSALPAADNPVTITIDPEANQSPISPFIYGTNQDLPGVAPTARRLGGNRTTGYNWENNASNAGADFFHQSDDFLTWIADIPPAQENIPGIVLTDFHEDSLVAGVPYTILTVPMAGYVARDKNGPVSPGETAPSGRWVEVQEVKGSSFLLSPNTTDDFVYNDEMINFLVSTYGPASSEMGVRGYSLDNEPDLWSHTHPRIHPTQPGAAELVSRSISLASAIKAVDPSAEVYGFVSYGFGGYYDFQGATDWDTERAQGDYRWFIDYFLDQMKQASDSAGQRLIDVIDLHNYSEHIAGGERVNSPSEWTNQACNLGRMQAPRSFWDPTFDENSWIGDFFADFLPFLPNIQDSIDAFYPGTKLAITEYNFGGEGHVSGGIAQADTLGIFGRDGVYLATWWQLHDDPDYIAAAFNLFLDYDGAGSGFGDTSVSASVSDIVNYSVYAAIDSNEPDKLHIVLLNKSDTQAAAGAFTIAGPRTYTAGRVWAFDANTASISERASIDSISGNTFHYSVPPLTAAHLVLSASTTPPVITVQPRSVQAGTGARVVFSVVASGSGPLTYQWRKDSVDLAGETGTSFTLPAITATDVGSYSVVVTDGGLSTTSDSATLSVTAGAYTPPTRRLLNLSTRGLVGTDSEVMIAGFFIGGSGAKRLLLRAVGPTLGEEPFSVDGTLADPRITLTTIAGAELAGNDDWSDNTNAADVAAAMTATGAFALPDDSSDAALLVELPPGGYTLIVRGAGNSTGVALAEVYDADPTSAAQMINISTRGPVGTGDAVMIAGFFLQGPDDATLLIRAVGPTLGTAPFNVPGVVADPSLELVPLGGSAIASNDDWSTAPAAATTASVANQIGAFALPDASNDAATVVELTPGGYTVPIRGVAGSTGVVLAEVYLAP